MRSYAFVASFIVLISCGALAFASDADRPEVGKAKVSWQDLPGVDGKLHSLAELEQREVVVVAITCNHCPIAIEYYDRMKDFARQQCVDEGRVALVAISLSDMETDRLPRMKQMAQRRGFNFPYLHDASQLVGKELGATTTPQFFVLDKNRTLVYRGSWDDNLNVSKVKQQFVADAVEAVLAGKSPAVKETRPTGCGIIYRK